MLIYCIPNVHASSASEADMLINLYGEQLNVETPFWSLFNYDWLLRTRRTTAEVQQMRKKNEKKKKKKHEAEEELPSALQCSVTSV